MLDRRKKISNEEVEITHRTLTNETKEKYLLFMNNVNEQSPPMLKTGLLLPLTRMYEMMKKKNVPGKLMKEIVSK